MADQAASIPRVAPVTGASNSVTRFRDGVVFYAVAGLLTFFFFFPFFWTVSSSLKAASEITTYPPVFWPSEPAWGNFDLDVAVADLTCREQWDSVLTPEDATVRREPLKELMVAAAFNPEWEDGEPHEDAPIRAGRQGFQ